MGCLDGPGARRRFFPAQPWGRFLHLDALVEICGNQKVWTKSQLLQSEVPFRDPWEA